MRFKPYNKYLIEIAWHGYMIMYFYCSIPFTVNLHFHKKIFLSCTMLEWVELTDEGISEWACGGGRQVITSWSHSRPTEQGMTLIQ